MTTYAPEQANIFDLMLGDQLAPEERGPLAAARRDGHGMLHVPVFGAIVVEGVGRRFRHAAPSRSVAELVAWALDAAPWVAITTGWWNGRITDPSELPAELGPGQLPDVPDRAEPWVVAVELRPEAGDLPRLREHRDDAPFTALGGLRVDVAAGTCGASFPVFAPVRRLAPDIAEQRFSAAATQVLGGLTPPMSLTSSVV